MKKILYLLLALTSLLSQVQAQDFECIAYASNLENEFSKTSKIKVNILEKDLSLMSDSEYDKFILNAKKSQSIPLLFKGKVSVFYFYANTYKNNTSNLAPANTGMLSISMGIINDDSQVLTSTGLESSKYLSTDIIYNNSGSIGFECQR